MTKSESRMQLPEDMENIVKAFALPYRDPKSHKNHKRVMAQIKRISKAWCHQLRNLEPWVVKRIQYCFLPSF